MRVIIMGKLKKNDLELLLIRYCNDIKDFIFNVSTKHYEINIKQYYNETIHNTNIVVDDIFVHIFKKYFYNSIWIITL